MNLRNVSLFLIIAASLAICISLYFKIKPLIGADGYRLFDQDVFYIFTWLFDLLYPVSILILGIALYKNSQSKQTQNLTNELP